MKTKIFFRHLFTSIRRRPIQPILLVLVIMLAVAASIASFDIRTYLQENETKTVEATYGKADYIVKANSFSNTRYIIADNKETFGENVDVCGVCEIPLLYGENNDFVYGVAVDIKVAPAIFEFDFTKYRSPNEGQLSSCIFVVEDWANRYGLTVGQEIRLNVLGIQIPFTIYGISPKKFMGSYTVMFDLQSVLNQLLSDSFVMSVLEEDIVFAGALYIRSDGEVDADYLSGVFPDMTITPSEAFSTSTLNAIDIITVTIAIVALLFSVLTIYCCFHILSAQRREETNLFYCVGAEKYMLNLASSAEMILYWLIGGVLGVFLSLGVAKYFISQGHLLYCTPVLHPKAVCLSLLFTFLASQISLSIFILSDERKQKKVSVAKNNLNMEIIFSEILLVISLGLAFTCYFIPTAYKAPIGLTCVVLIGLSTFYISRTCVKVASRFLSCNKNLSPSFLYALKNVGRVKTLGNTSGLVSLFVAGIFVLAVLLMTAQRGVTVNERFIQDDYLVLNVTETAVNRMQNTEGVDEVHSFYKDYVQVDDEEFLLLALSDRDVIFEGCDLDTLPQGNECYINRQLASRHGWEEGDYIHFYIGSQRIDTVYTKGLKTGAGFILLDASYWGLPMNYYAVRCEENFDSEVLYKNLMNSLAGQNASVVSSVQFFENWSKTVSSYILCIEIVFCFILIFSLVGMIDNIVSGYRSRKEEFACYMSAGMNKKMLRKLKTDELCITFVVGILTFLFFAVFLFFVIDKVLYPFGSSVIWTFIESNGFYV